jgi:hypothetical protein
MDLVGHPDKYKVTQYPQKGDVFEYVLDKKALRLFLKAPTVDVLHRTCHGFFMYEKAGFLNDRIKLQGFRADREYEFEGKSGGSRIGAWPVYTEFMDFMNDPDNIRKVLLDHGVHEELLSYVTIEYSSKGLYKPSIEMSIWIHTDAGDYFLEHNSLLYEDVHDTTFLYDFYDFAGFSRKYNVFGYRNWTASTFTYILTIAIVYILYSLSKVYRKIWDKCTKKSI